MTRDELNGYIHERIMGRCWHSWTEAENMGGYFQWCPKCDARISVDPEVLNTGPMPESGPDYCSDLSPRLLLEEVVAKVIAINHRDSDPNYGHHEYVGKLYRILIDDSPDCKVWLPYQPLTATTAQIARACVEAHRAAAEPAHAATISDSTSGHGEAA